MKKKKEPSIVWLIVPIPVSVVLFLGMSMITMIVGIAKTTEDAQKLADNLIFNSIKIGIPLILIIFWIIYLIYYCIKKSQK